MKKIKYPLIIILMLAGAWILFSVFSAQNKNDLRKPVEEFSPKENTLLVKNEIQTFTITTSGRMSAFNRVEIFAEVSGVLEPGAKDFKAGYTFSKNEVMIRITSDVYRNSLLAKKSNLLNQLSLLLVNAKSDFPDSYQKWEEYLSSFDMNESLNALPGNLTKRETRYLASQNILSSYHEIKSMEATLDKYSIKAPYDGVVTQSNINPGTLVRNGQKLGEFINTSIFEMAVPVKAADLHKLSIGNEVTLKPVNNSQNYKGKITRINSTIDKQTQSVLVFIQSSDRRIIEGMFFNAEINVSSKTKLARLPIKAVNDAGQVKIKAESKTELVNVEVIEKRTIDCLVSGLDDNSEIIIDNPAD